MAGALAYKPNAAGTIQRLDCLYRRAAQDQIFTSFEIPLVSLIGFGKEYSHTFCDYPDQHRRILFWDASLRERSTLEDDYVPSAYLSEFDQGLYGGLVGGEVRFMAHPENGWISSMVPPLLKNWSEILALWR